MTATIHYSRGTTRGQYGDGRPQPIDTARRVARVLRRRGYMVRLVTPLGVEVAA